MALNLQSYKILIIVVNIADSMMLQPLIGYAIFLSKQPSLIRNFSDKVEIETTREIIISRYYPQVTIIGSPSQKYQQNPGTLKKIRKK